MTDAILRDPLNPQAQALVDAQTEIKLLMKTAVLKRMSFSEISERLKRIVKRALAKVRSPTLQRDAVLSLNQFAWKTYGLLRSRLPDPNYADSILLLLNQTGTDKEKKQAEKIVRERSPQRIPFSYTTDEKGMPLQKYMKEYIRRNVSPVFRTLAKEYAGDPNAAHGNLRNLAEMQVRYEAQQKDIEQLRESGERLVVCSVHADCSDRCAPWQGRVYSLDGTSGTTPDGRKFVPLETATQVYKIAKSTGKAHLWGLLSYNCRHKLFPYREGMSIPKVSKQEQQKEYEITQTQRFLERRVLEARENALIASKDIDPTEYRFWKNEAARRNKEYIEFSRANKRAYYPDRTKLL